MKVLVLGATGMLGSMVYGYLKQSPNLHVMGTARKKFNNFIHFDVYDGFDNSEISEIEIDYVINCIGITKPYCHDGNMQEIKMPFI